MLDEAEHVHFHVGDVLVDAPAMLLDADLIMLDTDHDGKFEAEAYRFLQTYNFSGLVILDDIYLNREMDRFWASVKEPKVDLTDVGHSSGTGLVMFGSAHAVITPLDDEAG
mmetsp:Transcript_75598/g.177510  ORF Transcript_75598/g.177510 Transcript_75598/m.177510 type:complete len:111 (+) Transcript_75598:37-369(+)